MTTTSNVFVYLGLPSSLAPRGVDQGLEGGGVRPRQLDGAYRKAACGSGAAVRGRGGGSRGDGGGSSKGVCGGDRGAFRMPMAERRARIESTATVDSRTISRVRSALRSCAATAAGASAAASPAARRVAAGPRPGFQNRARRHLCALSARAAHRSRGAAGAGPRPSTHHLKRPRRRPAGRPGRSCASGAGLSRCRCGRCSGGRP